MVVFGQGGCIRAKWFYSGKVVVFGQNLFLIGQSCCIRSKWLYSGKCGCLRAKFLYSGKSGFIRAKVVVFGQIVLIGSSSKMRILGQKGKNPKNQKNLIFLNFSIFPFVITFKKNKYILF